MDSGISLSSFSEIAGNAIPFPNGNFRLVELEKYGQVYWKVKVSID